jgi:hypothetical protein
MTIESAFGEIGSCQDIADGGVVIALDRKKLERFFDDIAFGDIPLAGAGLSMPAPDSIWGPE